MKNSDCHGNQKEKKIKNLLGPHRKGEGLHLWHVASSSGPLPNTSNYGPRVEICTMLWGRGFHIEIKEEIFENLLVPNYNG